MEAKTRSHLDVYAIVTDRIIKQLEQGTVPWKRPWADAGIPQNLLSRRPYRGINVWLLSSLGYQQNLFLTWKQIKELGGSVKKDERSELVIFTRWIEKKAKGKDEIAKVKKMPFLRYYKVFNVAQCEGLPTDKIPPLNTRENNPIEACEAIYQNMPNAPEIHEDHDFAYYMGHGDYVNMPYIEMFESSESYYAVLFHELIHSTGHPARLNRKEWLKETSYATSNMDKYSLEELVAEMGACYLESMAGIIDTRFAQNASYIDGWLARLRSDRRFIVIAAALAQRAVDYILNVRIEQTFEEIAIAS